MDSEIKNALYEKGVTKVIISTMGFILLWALLTDAWGHSQSMLSIMPVNVREYIYGYISRAIWVIPSFILMIRFGNQISWSKQELFSRPKVNKSFLLILTASLAYCVIGMFMTHGGFYFNSDVNLLLVIIKYSIVGIVEEAAFRGWTYNALHKKMTNKNAIIISSLLFVGLHWPAYLIKLVRFGTFDFAGIIGQSIVAFVWGIIFCWLLKRGKSIWNPIIAHGFYDMLCVLLLT